FAQFLAVQFLALDGRVTLYGTTGYRDGNSALARRHDSVLEDLRFLFRTPVRSGLSFHPAGETWGHASQSAEMPSEMALVGKPRGQGDFRQWQLSLAEQVLNVFQAPL